MSSAGGPGPDSGSSEEREGSGSGGDRTSGEVDVDDEFLDVVSGLAEETPLKAPGEFDTSEL